MFQPGISGTPRTIPTNVGTTHNPPASGTDTRGLGTMLVRARQCVQPVHAVRCALAAQRVALCQPSHSVS